MNRIELGVKFGRLKLAKILPPSGAGRHRLGQWLCDCGRTHTAPLSRVKNGYVSSCGCYARELNRERQTTHGGRYTPEYKSWRAMRERCLNPSSKDYANWGGRGITICERWDAFEQFRDDMGPRPAGTTLDRINGSKGYEPSNCRWATAVEQARNRDAFITLRTPLGVMALVDYAKVIGLTRGAAHLRLKRGKLYGCERL